MKFGGRAKVPEAEQEQSAPVEAVAVVQAYRPTDLTVNPGGRRIGELLVEAHLVSRQQVVAALADAQREPGGKLLGERLVESAGLDERSLAKVVAWQLSLEVVDLREVTPDAAATRLLDETTARRIVAIPLAERDGKVVVAAAYPTDATRQVLRTALGKPVVMQVAARSDVERAIGNSYRALTGVTGQVRVFEAQHSARQEPVRLDISGDDDAPVVQVVQMIVTQALRDCASDIHIEPHEDQVRVRYRIDGALHDVLQLPLTMGPAVVSRVKILGGMNIVERRRPQDGQISLEVEGREVDIRVATTAVIEGEKV